MKAVILITSTPNCEPMWKSLQSAGHDVTMIVADGKDDAQQQQLVEIIRSIAPELIVYIGGVPEHHALRSLTEDTLRRIAPIAPFIHVCTDGGDDPWHPWLERYARIFHFQVNIDGCDAPHCLPWISLNDERGFTPLPWHERDIKFGIVGRYVGHGQRAEYITALQHRCGLHMSFSEGPYIDAVRVMCRIKVMFNHGMIGTMVRSHVKGRVIEAAYAGCALFENAESPLSRWLTPNVEFFQYNSIEDVERLLRLPDDVLQASAEALHARVMRDYSPRPAWDHILRKAGLLHA